MNCLFDPECHRQVPGKAEKNEKGDEGMERGKDGKREGERRAAGLERMKEGRGRNYRVREVYCKYSLIKQRGSLSLPIWGGLKNGLKATWSPGLQAHSLGP